MKPKPSKDYSLDRKDNNKGYSPDNCKWSTSAQQQRNKRPYSKSGFKGVAKHPHSDTYYCYATHDAKRIYLGNFRTKEEAAYMYDCFALAMYGDEAKTNFDYL